MTDASAAWAAHDPVLWCLWMALAGACVGSFINVLSLYWPARMKSQWNQDVADYLERPASELGLDTTPPPAPWRRRSACPACGTRLSAWQLIPLLSFVLLRGRCHTCGAAIGWRYPVVEASAAVLWGLLALHNGPSALTFAMALVLGTLLLLTLIDLDHLLLPDEFTLPLMWAGLLWHTGALGLPTLPLRDAVLGAVFGYLSLWAVYQAFKVFTGKEGMGYGDFKLLAALGAWLGWQPLLPIVLVASISGSVWGLGQIALKRQERSQPIPFGPWLALGGALEILQINPINPLWTHLLNA